MDRAKHRLKVVGLLLIIGGILFAMLSPALAPSRHSGVTAQERARIGLLSDRLTMTSMAVSSALMGAGIGLLTAGCTLRHVAQARAQDGNDSANNRVVSTS